MEGEIVKFGVPVELQILLFHLPLTYHWRITGTPNLTISPSIDLPLTNHRDSKSYYFTFHWLTTDESQGPFYLVLTSVHQFLITVFKQIDENSQEFKMIRYCVESWNSKICSPCDSSVIIQLPTWTSEHTNWPSKIISTLLWYEQKYKRHPKHDHGTAIKEI
jgi:hypothetical protein